MDYNMDSVAMLHLPTHNAYVTTAPFNSEDPEDGGTVYSRNVCLLFLNIIMNISSRR
jgi:hypothetical protein